MMGQVARRWNVLYPRLLLTYEKLPKLDTEETLIKLAMSADETEYDSFVTSKHI